MASPKFVSPYRDRPHYLIRWTFPAGVLLVVAADGTRPADGPRFPTRTEAAAWLLDNGSVPAA